MPGISYYRELAVKFALLLFFRWPIECSIVIFFCLVATNYEVAQAIANTANAVVPSARPIAVITIFIIVRHVMSLR